VAWGGLHGVYQVCGNLLTGLKKKIGLMSEKEKIPFFVRIMKIVATFCIVDFAWVFFAADSFGHALELFEQMQLSIRTTASIFELGLNQGNWGVLCLALVILMIVDIFHECGKSVFAFVDKQNICIRWVLYLGLIWGTIMLGIYGIGYDASQFIYFQF